MKKLICIVCPNGCPLEVTEDNGKFSIVGNKCPKGINFAIEEMTNPHRSVTSTVATIFPQIPFVPVRTKGEIPMGLVFDLMKLLSTIKLDRPYSCGEVILKNVLDTGIDVIATMNMNGHI